MCNACGFSCCAFDDFEGCGCNCDEWRCRVSRCGGCGQSVDATDPGADCECFPDDDLDWDDPRDSGQHLTTASPAGSGSEAPGADRP